MRMKALLFDVDNTLTTTQRIIRPRTIAALQKAHECGYILGVCTGRAWAELQALVLPAFPESSLHVVSGGAQVVDTLGTEHWSQSLSDAQVRELIAVCEATNASYIFAQGEKVYGSADELRRKEQMAWKIASGELHELSNWETPLFCAAKLSVAFDTALQSRSDISVKRMLRQADVPYVDITSLGVNKATGLKHWCELTGVLPKEIIGFGDSENDREFLQFVGHGVAVGNALPPIQKIADEVIGHTDHDGVSEYLEKLCQEH